MTSQGSTKSLGASRALRRVVWDLDSVKHRPTTEFIPTFYLSFDASSGTEIDGTTNLPEECPSMTASRGNAEVNTQYQ